MKLFDWLVGTLLLAFVVTGNACPDFPNVSKMGYNKTSQIPKPKLVLRVDEPKKHASEKYFHQLEPNVVLVNITGVLTLRLDCWAPYPITLQFSGQLTNQETTVKTFRKESGSNDDLKSCFLMNATMESFEQITGNYTCRSIENSKVFSSYYIYVSPTPPGVLLTRGQHIVIQPKLEETFVIFPCTVSHPDVHVQLKHKILGPLELSKDLSYDPKIGFRMTFKPDDERAYGDYSCQSELSPNDKVNFTLLRPKNFRKKPPVNNIRLVQRGKLNISCEAVEDFTIVLHSSGPTNLLTEINEVKQRSSSRAHFKYVGTFVSTELPPKVSGFVSCKWKSSNKTFAEWSFSVLENDLGKPGQLNTSRLKSACPNVTEMVLVECSNYVECQINSCVRKDSSCQSNSQICNHGDSCMQSGLIQCASGTTPVSEIFFSGYVVSSRQNKTTKYVGWEYAPVEELLLLEQIRMTDRSKIDAKLAEFSCQGSNFVFSSGFKWFVTYENGKRIACNEEGQIICMVKNSWKHKKSNLESTLTLAVANTTTKISNVECAAPVWNSWKWISRNVTVDPKLFTNQQVRGNAANFKVTLPCLMIGPVGIVVTIIATAHLSY